MNFYLLDHEATFDDLETYNFKNQKIGVIAYIEDSNGKILLQQRGKNSRDDNGLYECISGKVELEDSNFKSAIIREIKEEAGDEVNLDYSNSIGIYHLYKNNTNWIFVIYFVKYINGNFKIMEPDKCLGYKFFTYKEAIRSDLVTEACKYLIKNIKSNYKC